MSRIVCPSTRYSLRGLKQDLGSAHLRSLSLSDKGCVLYLPLNSLPNGISPDLSDKGNNGVNHGATLVDIGESYPVFWKNKLIDIGGKALSFDGVDDYVDCGDTNIPVGNTPRTVEAWVKPTGDGGVVVGTNTASGQEFFIEVASAAGTWYLFTDGANGANNIILSGSQIPPLDAWSHLVFVFDGVSWRYYLNGVLTKNGTFSVAINTQPATSVTIGWRLDVSGYLFNGLISEVRIYNRALSPAEIKAHFDLERVLFGV